MTSSHTRSVSKPDQPALLLIPSGGVRFESESGLLTTAICAIVWDAISSSLRRTSGFKVGFDPGESRISERVTLMAPRSYYCMIFRDKFKGRRQVHIPGLDSPSKSYHERSSLADKLRLCGNSIPFPDPLQNMIHDTHASAWPSLPAFGRLRCPMMSK